MQKISYLNLLTMPSGTIFLLGDPRGELSLCRLEKPLGGHTPQYSFVGPYYVSDGVDARPYEHLGINTEPCLFSGTEGDEVIILSPEDVRRVIRQLSGIAVGDGLGTDDEEARQLCIDFGEEPHGETESILRL